MIWFPFYSADFIGATAGLSCSERSMYALMLVFYYEVGPFPLDRVRVYRIIGCESDEQKRAVDHLLLEFFVQTPDGWYQEKAERVKVSMAQRSTQAADKARKRWATDAARSQPMPVKSAAQSKDSAIDRLVDASAMPQHCSSNADAMPSISTSTSTSTSTEESKHRDFVGTVQGSIIESIAAQSFDDAKDRREESRQDRSGAVGMRQTSSKPLRAAPSVAYDALGRCFVGIDRAQIETWGAAYPAVDVGEQIARAAAWCDANPTRRPRNAVRFLNAWMAKQQDYIAQRAAGSAVGTIARVARNSALQQHNAAVAEAMKARLRKGAKSENGGGDE